MTAMVSLVWCLNLLTDLLSSVEMASPASLPGGSSASSSKPISATPAPSQPSTSPTKMPLTQQKESDDDDDESEEEQEEEEEAPRRSGRARKEVARFVSTTETRVATTRRRRH